MFTGKEVRTRNQRCRLGTVMIASMAAIALTGAGVRADWPQWGGPTRDFKVADAGLAASWPADGPRKLWARELGGGYSAIAVENGTLYTMYRGGSDDVVVALDAKSGTTKWEYRYAAPLVDGQVKDFGEGPNATPLLWDGRLYTVGFMAHLNCLDAATGKPLWSHDLMKEFGAPATEFGYSSSPLRHGENLIVLVGGSEAGVVAFDPRDGTSRWKSKAYDVSYASPIVIDVDGEEQIVFMTRTSAVGIAAADGSHRWELEHKNQYKNNCATPLWGPDNTLLISSHSDGGTRALRLSREGAETRTRELWFEPGIRMFHSNSVCIGGIVYGCGGDGAPSFLVALDLQTGMVHWRERGYNKANVVYAGGRMIVLDEDGQLALARVSPEKFELQARATLLEKVSWTAPTLVGKTLYLRDKKTIMALDLG